MGMHIIGIGGNSEDEINTASKGRRMSKVTQTSKSTTGLPRTCLSACVLFLFDSTHLSRVSRVPGTVLELRSRGE